MQNTLKARLGRGELLAGTIVSLPCPETAEILSRCGFDWLFVDMEHGAIGFTALQRVLQAAGRETPCLVRPPGREEAWIKKSLDSGAAGVIVPRVNSAAEAEEAVRLAKYPPRGCRSVGISRAHGYGADFAGYLARANDEILVVPQIEDIDAVGRIEEIVRVPGIDALFIGPYDLSASMGRIGRVHDPEVHRAMERVQGCAREAGIALGIFAADADTARSWVEKGYRLVAVGMDAIFLAAAAGRALAAVRD